MNHTKGIWIANIENGGGGLNIQSETGNTIAHTAISRDKTGRMMITEEAIANAKLIAVAPELLNALEKLTSANKTFGATPDDLHNAIMYAYTIINKAKGIVTK